ncbi:GDSL-type esterase/lipase family protein [Sphingomonas sp. MMS24-JH45]
MLVWRRARRIGRHLCRYRADNARLAALPQEERAVVFMGDFITEAWKYGDPGFYTGGWIDRGISGQTTQQMLLRFPADVLALRPRAVHIMAGTNDIAGNTGPRTIEAIAANVAAMVTLAKAAGIRVILAATPPAARFPWAPTLQPASRIAALNDRLRALAARERVTFVDYGPVLARPDGSMKPGLRPRRRPSVGGGLCRHGTARASGGRKGAATIATWSRVGAPAASA